MKKLVELEDTSEYSLPQINKDASVYHYTIEESCSVAITDKKGIVTFVNDNFCRISKFTREELIGQDYHHHILELHTKSFIQDQPSIVENGKIWRSELKIKTKDGSYYWLGAIIVSFLNNKAKPYQHILIGVDITEHAAGSATTNKELAFQNKEKGKRAAELNIANRELVYQNGEKGKRAAELIIANRELVFQNGEKEKRAAELIIANEELVFQNGEKEKRAAELIIANKELAFQNEEKEKRAAELIIANKELAFQNEEKEKRSSELVIANQELVFQNEEKEKRAAELIITNNELKIAEEDIRKLSGDIHKLNEDLEQKVVERTAQLESVNRELESFSYSVSHDLRAPLRAVNGYAKILEEDYNLLFDDEGKRLLNIVQQNAKKMGVLIDDLLAFSKLGRKEINKSMVNMNEMAQNAISELSMSPNFKAEIRISDLHPAIADNKLMNQVWINILSNAIKYSSHHDKPVIDIVSEKKNGELIYSVTDNGVGFDMQYAHKLFGVFQRLHAAEDFEGTGVGLALVHRIITKQQGRVWAKAEIGKGATFYFSLPD